MRRPITKKLSQTLKERAIEGMIRSLLPLYPEYDRPGRVEVKILIQPAKGIKFLVIQEAYQMP